MGMGAALAALVSIRAAQAQTDSNTSTINSNEQVSNHGLPHQAPAIGLSSIYGLNPCATGSALGISTPLVGVGGAISTIDKECETRNNAAIAVSALQDAPLAREILCNISDIRQASMRLGRPCMMDQKPGAVAVAPAPQTQSAPANAAQPAPSSSSQLPPNALPPAVAKPIVASLPARSLPAFCQTPGLILKLYPACSDKAGFDVAPALRSRPSATRVHRAPPPHSALALSRSMALSHAAAPVLQPGNVPGINSDLPQFGDLAQK